MRCELFILSLYPEASPRDKFSRGTVNPGVGTRERYMSHFSVAKFWNFSVLRNTVIEKNNILIQHFKKSELMPKIHDEQNIKILIKDSIQSCTCKILPYLLPPVLVIVNLVLQKIHVLCKGCSHEVCVLAGQNV